MQKASYTNLIIRNIGTQGKSENQQKPKKTCGDVPNTCKSGKHEKYIMVIKSRRTAKGPAGSVVLG